ncbi:putative intracellular septation protein A [Candidatus Profftia lariciata]|uniref:septation protein A n=1 Tax=Candidatus Profftia lariciata TaxID=1987921 RepID=UPI001D007C06|nr:septation protein A [Candidatus Profftia lariciata]UDG81716.1 putative intracellular septation protein A [Candidatus Profftia lariciata]
MKQILYFLPLVVFFICYKIYDIYYASGALIIATAIDLLITYIRYGRIKPIMLITFFMVTTSCTLTLIFHNDLFIKWKVTIMYMIFALALIISQKVFKKPFIPHLLNIKFSLSDSIWYRLNKAWAIFFIVCAIINSYIALYSTQSVWVTFKVFGLTTLTLIYMLLSVIYIYYNTLKNNNK